MNNDLDSTEEIKKAPENSYLQGKYGDNSGDVGILQTTQLPNDNDSEDDSVPIGILLERKQQAKQQATFNYKSNIDKRLFEVLSSRVCLPSKSKKNKTKEDSYLNELSQLVQDEPKSSMKKACNRRRNI
jgi:hypothetical protein